MYTQRYKDDRPHPPENYCGNAITRVDRIVPVGTAEVARPTEQRCEEAPCEPQAIPTGLLTPNGFSDEGCQKEEDTFPRLPHLFSSIRIPRLFGEGGAGILSGLRLEELLLIGTALVLIFSKSGDFECAIILFLLLFIRDEK